MWCSRAVGSRQSSPADIEAQSAAAAASQFDAALTPGLLSSSAGASVVSGLTDSFFAGGGQQYITQQQQDYNQQVIMISNIMITACFPYRMNYIELQICHLISNVLFLCLGKIESLFILLIFCSSYVILTRMLCVLAVSYTHLTLPTILRV